MKKVIKIIKITQDEAKYLKTKEPKNRNNKWVNSCSLTHKSRNKTYFLVVDIDIETGKPIGKSLEALTKYRNSKIKERYYRDDNKDIVKIVNE